MRVHRNSVTPLRPSKFDEVLDFSSFDFSKANPLLGLPYVHVEGEFYKEEDDDTLYVYLHVEAKSILSDSRTLEPFEYELDYEDDFALLSKMEEEAEGYLFPENFIELFDVAYCSIHTHIPLCPKKEGSPLPLSGEGYSVYVEEEDEEKE